MLLPPPRSACAIAERRLPRPRQRLIVDASAPGVASQPNSPGPRRTNAACCRPGSRASAESHSADLRLLPLGCCVAGPWADGPGTFSAAACDRRRRSIKPTSICRAVWCITVDPRVAGILGSAARPVSQAAPTSRCQQASSCPARRPEPASPSDEAGTFAARRQRERAFGAAQTCRHGLHRSALRLGKPGACFRSRARLSSGTGPRRRVQPQLPSIADLHPRGCRGHGHAVSPARTVDGGWHLSGSTERWRTTAGASGLSEHEHFLGSTEPPRADRCRRRGARGTIQDQRAAGRGCAASAWFMSTNANGDAAADRRRLPAAARSRHALRNPRRRSAAPAGEVTQVRLVKKCWSPDDCRADGRRGAKVPQRRPAGSSSSSDDGTGRCVASRRDCRRRRPAAAALSAEQPVRRTKDGLTRAAWRPAWAGACAEQSARG